MAGCMYKDASPHFGIGFAEAREAGFHFVAHRLGYQSQAAFSRAYKRVVGTPPGQTRKAR